MENDSIQISAATVEDAIEKGLARLDLPRERVTVQVIDQGSRGLLGLGARDAVVRLTPVAAQAPTPEEVPAAPAVAP